MDHSPAKNFILYCKKLRNQWFSNFLEKLICRKSTAMYYLVNNMKIPITTIVSSSRSTSYLNQGPKYVSGVLNVYSKHYSPTK